MKKEFKIILGTLIAIVFIVTGIQLAPEEKKSSASQTELVNMLENKEESAVEETFEEDKEETKNKEITNKESEEESTEQKQEIESQSLKKEKVTPIIEDSTTEVTKEEVTSVPKERVSNSQIETPQKVDSAPIVPTEVQSEPQVPQASVTVTVTGINGVVASQSIPYQEGDTALSATVRLLQINGLHYSIRGSGSASYVEGLAGLYEFDHGPLSGWLVYIDGNRIGTGSGSYSVQAGSHIHWQYTTNFLE